MLRKFSNELNTMGKLVDSILSRGFPHDHRH